MSKSTTNAPATKSRVGKDYNNNIVIIEGHMGMNELRQLNNSHYPIDYYCTNCLRDVTLHIPKRSPAPRKVKVLCPNCECQTLLRDDGDDE